jgi:hypothetical protein
MPDILIRVILSMVILSMVILIMAIKINDEACRRHASGGIQNMCGQPTHLIKLPFPIRKTMPIIY